MGNVRPERLSDLLDFTGRIWDLNFGASILKTVTDEKTGKDRRDKGWYGNMS